MPSDEDKSTNLAKLLTMASRSVGTFDHILSLARNVTTDTELKHILLSSGNGGGILLAEILMAASRDFEAFAAVSKLSRGVTTVTERKVILMSGGGDGITVLSKILISASLDVKVFPVVMKFSREVVSDLEMKEILMSSAGDESTVLAKMLVSASREVGALHDIIALSREINTDLEVVGFLAAKDEYGDTCLSHALKNQNLTWFRKLWETMRSFMNPNQLQEAFLTKDKRGNSMLRIAMAVEDRKAGAVEVVLTIAQGILTDVQLDALISSPAVVENAKENETKLLKGVKESIERRRSQETCKPFGGNQSGSELSRTGEMSAGLGDCNTNATWETNNGAQEVQPSNCVSKGHHQTLKEETLAHSLRAGPRVFRSEVYGVELELQEGSLEQDVNAAVTISPQLRFVVCQTEYQSRTLSEEFLAMPFINGPEGVRFREDKPALLRFFLGLVEDFLSGDVTDTKSVDQAIKKTVREWYTPLSSPDGIEDWVSLGPYAMKYRHEGEDQEVWVETPIRHFSKVANGVKTNIPGYKHKEHARDHYYYGDISWLPRRMRSRAANLKVRFGNATQNFATFTSRPIVETTEKSEEAETRTKASAGFMEGTFGWHRRSNVRGRHLPAFPHSATTVVASGQFEDFEMPCDIEVHKQMRVRVGVLQNLTSSGPDAKGKLQLLDERPISGNMILVLRQPRLEAPSEFGKLSWPREKEKIFQV